MIVINLKEGLIFFYKSKNAIGITNPPATTAGLFFVAPIQCASHLTRSLVSFSGSDGSGSDSDMDMGSESVERREGVKRAAAAKAVAKFADSER